MRRINEQSYRQNVKTKVTYFTKYNTHCWDMLEQSRKNLLVGENSLKAKKADSFLPRLCGRKMKSLDEMRKISNKYSIFLLFFFLFFQNYPISSTVTLWSISNNKLQSHK